MCPSLTVFARKTCLLIPLLSSPLFASTAINHSLVPVADTYIRGGIHADTNLGVETSLYVRNGTNPDYDRIAYLRFDLSALKATNLSNVQLQLYGRNADASPDPTVKVYGLTSDSWSETLLTWNNASPTYRNGKSAPTGAVYITSFTVPTGAAPVVLPPIDVTSFVNSQMSGDKIVTLMLINETTDSRTIIFRSSDHASEPRPRLTFTDPVAKVVLNPVADAYVQNGLMAAINYGSADLKVRDYKDATIREDRLTYLKFDRSSVGASPVKRATLRLYAKEVKVNLGATNSNSVQLYGLSASGVNDWVETSVNWNNSPNHHLDTNTLYISGNSNRAKPLTGVLTTPASSPVVVDITDYLNDKRPSLGTVGFMIMAEPNSPNVNFGTREAVAANQPFIQYSAIDGQGQPVNGTLYPTKDMYVRSGIHAGTNFGSDASMGCSDNGIDTGRISYLMFDANSIPKVSGVDTVTSATLNLRALGATTGNAFKVYTFGTDFDETTSTWNSPSTLCHDTKSDVRIIRSDMEFNAKRLNARIVDQADKYYEFDVTDFVNDRKLVDSENLVTFLIQGGYSVPLLGHDIETTFGSREGVASQRPELVIEPGTLADNLVLRSSSVVDSTGLLYTHGAYGLAPNLAQAGNDRIMTYNGYQYATYYNAAREVRVARRPVNGTWESTKIDGYNFVSNDAHNYTAIGISPGDGTIHLAFDHHRTELNYVISDTGLATNPGTSTWTSGKFSAVRNWLVNSSTPIPSVSYAQFITQPDGAMMMNFSENGTSRRLHRYSSGSWATVGGSDGRFLHGGTGTHTVTYPNTWLTPVTHNHVNSRRMYSDEFIYDSTGGLHFSWCWREQNGLGKNHDLMYAYSPDNGNNWYNAPSGTQIAQTGSTYIDLSDTPTALVAAVTDRQGMVNNGSIAVDPLHQIHIMANYNDDGAPAADNNKLNSVVRFHHHWKDEHGVWRHTMLPYYGTARPKIVASADAVYMAYANHERLVIAKATRVADYTDWEIIKTWAAPSGFRYFTGVAIDTTRMRDYGVLSIYIQDEQDGASSTPIRVLEFDL